MDCTSPIDSIACLVTTTTIVLPLVVVSWLVGMMLAAYVLRANRAALAKVGVITLPLGLFSMLIVAIAFAELEVGGMWELLAGPAVVFGQCVAFARGAALRGERT